MADRKPEIRCPRLGHPVPLSYCYHMGEGSPCNRLLACWEPRMPNLRRVLEKQMGPEKMKETFESPPKPKLEGLIELAEKAKEK